MSLSEENSLVSFETILKRIEQARAASPLAASRVILIAVAKTHGPERMIPLLKAGHRHFGENRVQEAQEKWPALKAQYPDIVLHLIGPLQTNKVKEAVALFDVLHTLDRPKLADSLANEMEKTHRRLPCLVQVNTGEEPQKAGISPQETADFLTQCHHLPVRGLMCIPPATDNPAPHFGLLQQLAKKHGLPDLSMGMSSDFEMAVSLGATYVRVGSAIFGDR